MNRLFIALIILSIATKSIGQQPDKIVHYSAMDAMRNGVYTGDVTVQQLGRKGDFGLGTYHLLDGELVALDGTYYRVAANGAVTKAELARTVPFGSFTFFKSEQTFTLKHIKDVAALQTAIIEKLPSANRFYALKITATFDSISLGGAAKLQENDTTGIARLMKTRPLYKKQNVKGTIVGFYNPPYIGGVDLSPLHLHFIANDKTFGGHLVAGRLSEATITVSIDEKDTYEIILPGTNNKGYQRKWKTTGARSAY